LREGVLHEIAREVFSRKEPHRYNSDARQILLATRSFGRRLEYDQQHAEHVRELSLMLFDQLQPVHHLPVHARVQLEAGALLHDVGHRVSHRGHHKHGEYLALNGDIPGLQGRDRHIVAAVVRYHNRKSEPDGHHPAYSGLTTGDKRVARRLASIVRIAEGLDHSHRQRVLGLKAAFQRGAVTFEVDARGDATEDLRDAQRCADLFEKEFRVQLFFRSRSE
jgi:exopolyphosphatase/guanosine-5'-triphosphate,3'-diphosphate pyrophosphatase